MKLGHCPFCPDGEGRIDVDTDAAQFWEPPSGRIKEVRINNNADQPIVKFLRRPGEPCPHLIFLHLNLDPGRGTKCWHPITLSWLHPFFLGGAEYARFQGMWHALVEPTDQSYAPSVRYQVRDPERSWRRTRGGETVQSIHCCGTAVYVDDVSALFGELQQRISASASPITPRPAKRRRSNLKRVTSERNNV